MLWKLNPKEPNYTCVTHIQRYLSEISEILTPSTSLLTLSGEFFGQIRVAFRLQARTSTFPFMMLVAHDLEGVSMLDPWHIFVKKVPRVG